GWISDRELQDPGGLLDAAAHALQLVSSEPGEPGDIAGWWLDGFARLTPQERELLVALAPHCRQMTLAFCLDKPPDSGLPWHSVWAGVAETCRRCQEAMSTLEDIETETVLLEREIEASRFHGEPALRHLEEHWLNPTPFIS